MKLGVGTVQLGMDYGISNQGGRTESREAAAMLKLAWCHGVRVIDTAPLYGESERVLGEILGEGHPFQVVTKSCKIGAPRIRKEDAGCVLETFRRSLQRLRQPSVYGLLLHDAWDLLAEGGERLMDVLLLLKERGEIAKVGVSVYSPFQVEQVLERFPIDLIQLPVNVLDQRLIRGGQLSALKKCGVEVHARSAFLQGALLMDPGDLPPHFEPVRPLLDSYHRFRQERGLTAVQAALAFATGLEDVDVVVCGFNNAAQLQESCLQLRTLPPIDPGEFQGFAVADEEIVDPSKWRV